jgi:dipeptidase E
MGKIIAIGGGEIGRPGYPVETGEIDREIVRLTKKSHPRLLFIPTASSDSESYYATVKKHFGGDYGCKTDVLYLIKDNPTTMEIEEKILNADIVYVGGGNTQKMIRIWKRTGTDVILKQAYENGIVLSGLSAGAICWFRWGNSDSRKFHNPSANLIKVSGLNWINALYCPHYDFEQDRRPQLFKMMMKTPGVALAFDNCCAIEIINGKYRILSAKPSANAYQVYRRAGAIQEKVIPQEKTFRPLEQLLSKRSIH